MRSKFEHRTSPNERSKQPFPVDASRKQNKRLKHHDTSDLTTKV
jgi:hypothetical protein